MPRELRPGPIDWNDFLNRWSTFIAPNLVQEDLLNRFVDAYRNDGTLIKFLMENCAHYHFDDFIKIAIVLKNLIDDLHGDGSIDRLVAITATPGLTHRERLGRIHALMSEHPFRPTIPQNVNIPPRDLFNLLFQVFAFADAFFWFLFQRRSKNFTKFHAMFNFIAAIVANLLQINSQSYYFFWPSAFALNCLGFPSEYRPHINDSPGRLEYKNVLRHIHLFLYQKNDRAIFAGDLQNWLDNRNAQWQSFYYKVPNLIVGYAILAPAAIPILAFKYEKTRNDIKSYHKTKNLSTPVEEKNVGEFALALHNFAVFTVAAFVISRALIANEIIDSSEKPYYYNEFFRRYLTLYATLVLSFIFMVAVREIRAAKTVIPNVTQVRQVFGFVWPRQNPHQGEAEVENPANHQHAHRH